jgi:predicted esterase
MKALHFAILLILSFLLVCCGGAGSSHDNDIDSSLVIRNSISSALQKGKIISNVVCQAAPNQSYALYIPEANANQHLPIIYFFDPHGDGLLPVKKYKALADSFHFILAGSNNSKNGNDFNDAGNIFEAMNADVQKRVAMNADRIYLCGFSGGAKVATYLALRLPGIKGVIANGAGLEDITTAGNFTFSFTAVTGNGDLNMTDLVSIDKILDNTSTQHQIIFFDGIHEWAPESTMAIAFAGLQLDAMRKNSIPKDTSFINGFEINMKKIIEKELNKNEWIKAHQNSKLAAAMLNKITDGSNWFIKKENSIEQSAAFQNEENERQSLLKEEGNMKAVFQRQFMNGDENYWTKTIEGVKEKAKIKSAEGQMYQRLQAYLSLAFYSISNQMIQKNQNQAAEYFVSLYKLADPANSEAWYFSAIIDARNHNALKAKEDLGKAVALGFNDKKRLELQPEFSNNNISIDLAEVERKMK